jgi:phosphomannomutase
VADFVLEEGTPAAPIPVGHDARFLGPRFAAAAAAVLEGNGLATLLPEGPVTTPMVSCQVVGTAAPIGLAITASHNPAHYNGVKVKAAFGGSAPPEITSRIEAHLGRRAPRRGTAPDRRHPFLPAYVPRVLAVADVGAVRRATVRVVVDSMHGAAGRILEDLVGRRARARITTIRGTPDVLFGGSSPEPKADHLGPLREAVTRTRAHIGLALDGDGDRIGVCDEAGRVLTPGQVFGLLAVHLIDAKGWRGGIARTFANTLLARRIADHYHLPFFDLPIGFKHVARLMIERDILIGGEESGGIGVRKFLPERDGILVGLLLLEMLAAGDRRTSRRVADLESRFGRYVYRRVDLPIPAERGRAAVARLQADPPARLGGRSVRSIETLDGLKLLFGDAGWILFRASGTEPVLRVYCEAAGGALCDRLIAGGLGRLRATRGPSGP